MNRDTIVASIAVVALVVSLGVAVIGGGQDGKDGRDGVGAVPGGDFHNQVNFLGGVTHRNLNATSTTATTQTMELADLVRRGQYYSSVHLTPNVGDLTLTWFASTTGGYLPKVGDRHEFCLYNASTTAGIDLTLAAGTGVDIETASSTISDLTIDSDSTACIKAEKKPNTDISVLITEYNDAD